MRMRNPVQVQDDEEEEDEDSEQQGGFCHGHALFTPPTVAVEAFQSETRPHMTARPRGHSPTTIYRR